MVEPLISVSGLYLCPQPSQPALYNAGWNCVRMTRSLAPSPLPAAHPGTCKFPSNSRCPARFLPRDFAERNMIAARIVALNLWCGCFYFYIVRSNEWACIHVRARIVYPTLLNSRDQYSTQLFTKSRLWKSPFTEFTDHGNRRSRESPNAKIIGHGNNRSRKSLITKMPDHKQSRGQGNQPLEKFLTNLDANENHR